MFQDKEIVTDYLSSINASLSGYASMIAQTDNQQLRQALIQLRNGDEVRQRRIYEFAVQQGFYKPANQAQPEEIQQVKSSFAQQMQQTGGASQNGYQQVPNTMSNQLQ